MDEDLQQITETPVDPDIIDETIELPADFTNYIDDDSTLMGTVFKVVFGDLDVMIFFAAAMIITTLLIVSVDFMKWKGRD